MAENGWIGVDLDGTLAVYDEWEGVGIIGEPVKVMQDRVLAWLAEGKDVRIMTARVSGDQVAMEEAAVKKWCQEHLGRELPVTCCKDYLMGELYDDRAVTVEKNTGKILTQGREESDSIGAFLEGGVL